MTKTVDELIDEAVEGYIFTSCKDYGNTRNEFDTEYIKYLLVEKLVDEVMHEHHPRGDHLG